MLVSPTATTATRRPVAGLLCLTASGLLWGTGGLTGTLLARTAGLSPIAVAAYRLTAGGTLIVAFLLLNGRRTPAGRAAWLRIATIGLLAGLFQASYFAAVSLTSVSLATLVTIGSCPVLVLLAERATGRRIGRRAATTTCLALAGLGLLVGVPAGGYGTTAVLAGAGAALLAAGGFAAMTIVGSRPVPGLDDLAATGFGFASGGLALVPIAALTAEVEFSPTPAAIGLLVALASGPTAVAYTLYFRGLRTAPARTAAVMTLLEPLTAALLAVVVLDDRLGAPGLAGAVLLAAAVVGNARSPS